MEEQTSAQADRKLYRHADLERLIDPRVVAVVGASPTPGSFGQRTIENLAGFGGRVYGVNPKYRDVLGRECFPSLLDLPEPPDSVIVGVAQHFVQSTLQDAAVAGAGGAIVYASGYSETGVAEAVDAQRAIEDFARDSGIRVAGPNCVGLVNLGSGAAMNFMTDCGRLVADAPRGSIGIVSQSGALGYTVLQSVHRGVGISHYLAAGNSADIDVCDYIAYLAEDPGVKAIICLMEGVKSGPRFLEAGRLAREAGKPLLVYKAGNSEKSGQAAMSHTGTLTGSTAAYRAAFKDVGAIWLDDLEALTETASFFTKNTAHPKADGVGILATSGGAGVINADKAEEAGLALPSLSEATKATLAEVVPAFGSVGNPADLTAEVLKDPQTFIRCVDAFTSDESFGAVVVPLVFVHDSTTGQRAGVLSAAAARTDTPVAAVWMNEWLEGPGSRVLDADENVTLFRSATRCMQTIRHWQDWHAHRAALSEGGAHRHTQRLSDPGAEGIARRIIASAASASGALSERDSKAVLEAYGIRVPRERLVATAHEAVEAAEALGYPLVAKIASADIHHKTEVSGIRLGLNSAEDARTAVDEILESVSTHAPFAEIDGVSLQTQLSSGPEILLGARIDAQFGPLVTVGSGGVLVELVGDVAATLAPVSVDAARELLSSLRGYALLEGVRGDSGYDIDAVAEVVARFSELIADLSDVLVEVDVNPVIAARRGATAADALIVARQSEPVAVEGVASWVSA